MNTEESIPGPRGDDSPKKLIILVGTCRTLLEGIVDSQPNVKHIYMCFLVFSGSSNNRY